MSTDTQGQETDTLLDDLLEAVGETPEPAPVSADATPTTDQSPAPDAPPAAPEPSSEGEPASAPEAPRPPDELQAPISPFDGGEPFTFRVDGQHVALDGVKLVNDHVVIPVETWRTQVQANLLGHRGAWREREGAYKQEIGKERQQRQAIEAQHNAIMAEVQQMFADPQVMLEKLQNWQVNGPLLQAQIEARAAKAQVEQFQRQQQEVQRQQQEAAQEPKLKEHLGDTVEQWLTDNGVDWTGDQDTWVEFLHHLWDTYGKDVLYIRDPLTGRLALNEDRVYREFQREVSRAKSRQQAVKAADASKARNQAALAPAKPATPAPVKAPPAAKATPERPRDATGKFTKSEEPFDAQAWLHKRSYLDEE